MSKKVEKVLKLAGRRPMLLALIMATLTLGLLFSGWLTPVPGRAQTGNPNPPPNNENTNCPNYTTNVVTNCPSITSNGQLIPTCFTVLLGGSLPDPSVTNGPTSSDGSVVTTITETCSNTVSSSSNTIRYTFGGMCYATNKPTATNAGTYSRRCYIPYTSSDTNRCPSGTIDLGSVTWNVVQFTSQCVATTPTNRARTTIGVGETVNLSIVPAPCGTVTWMLNGGGSLSSYSGSTTTFTAPNTGVSCTITATNADGFSVSKAFIVIPPSGAILENKANTLTTSTSPLGLSYQAYWYIQPDSVSFCNIKIAEGVTNSIATGYYYPIENNEPHNPGSPAQMGAVIPGKGTLLNGVDNISGGSQGPPYSNGKFTWHIPCSYITPDGSTYYFTTIDHIKELTSTSTNATLTITKKGSSGSITAP